MILIRKFGRLPRLAVLVSLALGQVAPSENSVVREPAFRLEDGPGAEMSSLARRGSCHLQLSSIQLQQPPQQQPPQPTPTGIPAPTSTPASTSTLQSCDCEHLRRSDLFPEHEGDPGKCLPHCFDPDCAQICLHSAVQRCDLFACSACRECIGEAPKPTTAAPSPNPTPAPTDTCFDFDVNYVNADIRPNSEAMEAETADECQAACAAKPECTHFTFRTTQHITGRTGCWLKDYEGDPSRLHIAGITDGLISGPKACPPPLESVNPNPSTSSPAVISTTYCQRATYMASAGELCPVQDHIDEEGACKSAAQAMSIVWGGAVTERDKPEGCFYDAGNQEAYYNADRQGIMAENTISFGGVCNGCRK